MGLFPSRTHKQTTTPAPVNDPVRQRPYGTADTEKADAELAAGYIALATFETAEQRRARLFADVQKNGDPLTHYPKAR